MDSRKYDLNISRLSSQIQNDVAKIFKWLDKTVVKASHTNRTYVGVNMNILNNDKIATVLEVLDYPYSNFTKEHFIKHIAEFLERKVILVPIDLSRAVSGACVRQFHIDYIFYNQKRHGVLQDHIVLHESAHLLLNHRLRTVTVSDIVDRKTTEQTISKVRFRSHLIFRDLVQDMDDIEHEQEEQAEAFARLFIAQVQLRQRHRNLTTTKNINLFPPFSNR